MFSKRTQLFPLRRYEMYKVLSMIAVLFRPTNYQQPDSQYGGLAFQILGWS